MEKEFIPYEQSLDLKELGFDEPTLYAYFKIGGFNKYSRVYEPIVYTLNTNGNPFGEYFNGRNWNISITPKSKIQCSAPTFSQSFRWFREKYKLNSLIIDSISYSWYFNINDMQIDDVVSEVLYFKSYEKAELECLKKLIEIVKEK